MLDGFEVETATLNGDIFQVSTAETFIWYEDRHTRKITYQLTVLESYRNYYVFFMDKYMQKGNQLCLLN